MSDTTDSLAWRRIAALAAISVAWAVAGCGGSDAPSADGSVARVETNGQTLPAATTPTTAAPATTTGATTTPRSAPAGRTPTTTSPSAASKAQPKAKKPARAKGTTSSSAPAAGANAPGGPAPDSDQGPTIALECLAKAKLVKPEKRSPSLWGATTKDGTRVLVDGPYPSTEHARQSADTLEGVTRAEPGGIYVVSAPLSADVGSEVAEVARCLQSTA